MKKIIILLFVCMFFVGCSNTNDVKVENTQEVSSETNNTILEDEESVDTSVVPELVPMTDSDMKSLNDAISTYLFIDDTLKDADIEFKIEEINKENTVIFVFKNVTLEDDFDYNMLSSIYGALTVTGLSVEYESVIAELYDNNGSLIESKVLNK